MNKKIFRAGFFTSMLVLVISFIMVFGVLFEYFEEQIFEELKSEANYIAYAIENEGVSYIHNFDNENKRITLVAANGIVVADTAVQASGLDNHANRVEIADALKYGNGRSTRNSDTLMQKNLYYAVRMNNGNILRVSTTQNSIALILLGLMQPLVLIIFIALMVTMFLSSSVSKAIVKPINSIDLDNPSANDVYDELSPLLSKIATQKATIERQIRQAKQKQEEFKLITDNMNEGLLVIDTAYNLLTYNHAALKLLEISDVEPGSVLMLNRTKNFRAVIQKALEGQRAVSELLMDEHCYNLIASPVTDNGKVIGAVIVIIDITESARREQLRREFTANVSHELKTPLTSISGFAEMLRGGGLPDETVRDFASSVYDEAQRLIRLVSDIIKLSELDENSIQFDKKDVDLYRISSDVLNRLKPNADKLRIRLQLTGQTTNIVAVEKIVEEIIYNLCDNAIKYNKPDGAVDVIVSSTGNKATVTVRDTGIGIPAGEQDRIFERFYRVDKSHSKEIGGTGLGLAIVKHGANYHNAEINIDSVEGKGTSISVTFMSHIN